MNKYLIICIFIILGTMLLAGCGKKRWPTADVTQEKFHWENVNSTIKGKCLNIRASIKGNIQNVKKIVLLLEESGEMCQDCPFRATKIVPVYTALGKDNTQSEFEFGYCKLKEDKSYRFRLKGINEFDNIGVAETSVRELRF